MHAAKAWSWNYFWIWDGRPIIFSQAVWIGLPIFYSVFFFQNRLPDLMMKGVVISVF